MAEVGEGHVSDTAGNCGELEFVNLFGTPKNCKQKSRAVRSHVMRLVRKRQAKRSPQRRRILLAATKVGNPSPPSQSTTASSPDTDSPSVAYPQSPDTNLNNKFIYPSEKTDSCVLSSNSGSRDLSVFSPSSQIYLNRSGISRRLRDLDSFYIFPIKITSRIQQLLQFTTLQTVRTSVHEDPTNAFFSGVGNSPALLHITLSFAVALMGNGSAKCESESGMHLQQALSYINKSLKTSNNGESELEDSTIAAVACMSNMETLNCDESKALIHVRGLQSMVKLKGGLDALGMNGTLRRLVLWADICNATRWNTAPIFPSVHFPTLLPLSTYFPKSAPNPILAFSDAMIASTLLINTSTNACNLPSLLQNLHELALFLDSTDQKDVEILHVVAYADRSYLVENATLLLIFQQQSHSLHFPNPALEEQNIFLELLLQSLLLYIYTNVRLTPVGSSLRRTIVSRIYAHASKLPYCMVRSLVSRFPREMVWIFFLAGSTSTKKEERVYFVGNLTWMCESKRLGNWEDVVEELRRFLWLIGGFLWRCREVWGEIKLTRDGMNNGNRERS